MIMRIISQITLTTIIVLRVIQEKRERNYSKKNADKKNAFNDENKVMLLLIRLPLQPQLIAANCSH